MKVLNKNKFAVLDAIKRGGNLEGANLVGANLVGANLVGAKLNKKDIQNIVNRRTILPDNGVGLG